MKPNPTNEVRAAFPERDANDPGHARLAEALTGKSDPPPTVFDALTGLINAHDSGVDAADILDMIDTDARAAVQREIADARAESTHTPGPWEVGPDLGSGIVIRADKGRGLVGFAVFRNNAALLAAAPSLLEALHATLDRLDYLTQDASAEDAYGNEQAAKIARAAIARATGGVA